MAPIWPFLGVKAPDSTWKKRTVKWIYGSKSQNAPRRFSLPREDWKSLWLWSEKIADGIIHTIDNVLILTTASGESSFVMAASIVRGPMLNMEELMRSIVTQKVRKWLLIITDLSTAASHTVGFYGKYGQFRSPNGTRQFWSFPVEFWFDLT